MNGLFLVLFFFLAVLVWWFLNRRAEGFGDFRDIQTDYTDGQRSYFDLIEKAVPVNNGLSLNPVQVNTAFRKTFASPVSYLHQDYSKLFYEEDNRFRDQDFQFCRGAAHPRNISRATRATIGCGWWYVDGTGISTGALGTLKGPIDTTLGTTHPGGRWIWNLEEAGKLEDMKKCRAVTVCAAISGATLKGECGFCPDLGYAIPIKSDGTVKYPDQEDSVCASALVLAKEQCPVPPAGTGVAGDPTVEYNENGIVVSQTGVTQETVQARDLCDLVNGKLTRDCLLGLAKSAGLSEAGAVAKLIRRIRPANEEDQFALRTLREKAQLVIPDAVLGEGTIDVTGASNVYGAIKTACTHANSQVKEAALYLAVGNEGYNICSFTDSDTGPFPTTCLQREFRKAGCQPAGVAAPTERNSGAFATKTMGAVRQEFANLYASMKSATTQEGQNRAMMNCLGTQMYKKKPEVCKEAGIEYIVYTRTAEGKPGVFMGRFISTRGLVGPGRFWEGPSVVKALVDKAGGSAYYVIRTNATLSQTTSMKIAGSIPPNSADLFVNGSQQTRTVLRTQNQMADVEWNFSLEAQVSSRIELVNGKATAAVGFPTQWDYAHKNLDRFQLKQESWRPVIALDFFRGSLTDHNEIIGLQANNQVQIGDLGGKRCALFARKQGRIAFQQGIHTDNIRTITIMYYANAAGDNKSLLSAKSSVTPSSQFFLGNPGNTATFLHSSYLANGSTNKYWGMEPVTLANPTGRWIHLSLILYNNRRGAILYVNGESRKSFESNTELQTALLDNIVIGEGLDGGIAWVHVYPHKLTPEEMKRDMNYDKPDYEMATVPLEEPDLVGDQYVSMPGKEYTGSDIREVPVTSAHQCANECFNETSCMAFTFDRSTQACRLKQSTGSLVTNDETTAGLMTKRPVVLSSAEKPKYVMDVAGVRKDNGAQVYMWENWNGPNQQWTLTPEGNIKSVNSGKCLDVTGAGTTNGTGLLQWDCHQGNHQRFTVDSESRIHPVHAPEKCLDVDNTAYGRTANGARLQIWDCNDGANQKFSMRAA